MAKVQMVLYGKTTYMKRLALCIQKHKPDYLELARYEETAENGSVRADLLLREKGTDAEASFIEREVDILLSRDCSRKGKETEIFCYQKGQEILRQAFLIYQRHDGEIPAMECGMKYGMGFSDMEVIYALDGNEWQLLYSMAYAAKRGQDKKVLFVNLGAFSGMLELLNDSPGENFSDLFYAVQQKPERFAMIFQGLVHHTDYVDYIQPPENPSDLFEVQESDIEKIIQFLGQQTEYELVVWNCDTWNPFFWKLLSRCGSVHIIHRETVAGKCGIQELRHFLEKESCEAFREKVQFVSCNFGKYNLISGESIWEQLRGKEWGTLEKAEISSD